MSDLISTFIRSLPTEAAILISRDNDRIISLSARAKQICEDTSEQWVLSAAKDCRISSEGLIREFITEKASKRDEFLGERECLRYTFRLKDLSGDNSLAVLLIQEIPSYDQLLEDVEAAEYAARTLNQGLALMRSSSTPQKSSDCVFVTEKFAELSGTSLSAIQKSGLSAVLESVIKEDLSAFTRVIANLNEPDWSVAVRLTVGGESVWRRFLGKSIQVGESEEIFETSILCENYSEGAKEAALKELMDSPSGEAASTVLSSLISTMFDASVYVDEEFKVVRADEKSRVCSFLIGDNDKNLSIEGLSLDSFIPDEAEKNRFRDNFVNPLIAASALKKKIAASSPSVSSNPLAPALMIHTRMVLANGEQRDVKIYGCPTFLHILPTFSEESVGKHLPSVEEFPTIVVGSAARSDPSWFLIGIRLASQAELEPSIPVGEVSDRIQKGRTFAPILPVVEENVESSEFDSETNFPRKARRPPMPKQDSVALSLHRLLHRDVLHSLLNLDSEPVIADWLVVRYSIADSSVMEEELVRSLSSKHQAQFLIAAKSNNYPLCAAALQHASPGNANIFEASPAMCDNADLLHCAFRFFLGIIDRISDQLVATRLLSDLENAMPRIALISGKLGHDQTLFEFTLMLLTAAIRFPAMCCTPASLQRLRKYFNQAMTLRGSKKVDKSRKLPANYFLCVLWASLMHIAGRADEASALLRNLLDDMRNYCLRHPEAISVRKLQSVCLHNLAATAILEQNLVAAFGWIHELQTIVLSTHVTYPKRCNDLIEWARNTQSEAQAHFRRVRE